jgi:hypothetical protein
MKTFMQLNISIKQLSHEKFENNKGRIRRRTDNIMANRRRTDNIMANRRRTDNIMANRKRTKG